jgi:putative redox protein
MRSLRPEDGRDRGQPAVIRASARHLSGLAHAVDIHDHTAVVDASADAGGDNDGPTPQELLTGALAACTAITVRMYGHRKGWDLDGLEVVAEARPGDRGACGPFEVTLRLPKELSEEQLRRLRVIASKCPVHRTLASAEACVIEDRVERI